MVKVSKRVVLTGSGICFFSVLLLPVSNFFLPRDQIKVSVGTPEFAAASKLMQSKCSDCHTPQMTVYPIYFKLPLANQIIEADIEEAQKHLLISKRKLSGKERFTASEQAKIYAEIDEQKMPPSKYKLLHWNAGISEIDKEVILTWIKSEGASLGVKPIPAENPFKPEPKKATLGKKLFHDERLSGDNSVSCATCHEFDKGGSDQLKTSTGINGHKGPINSPTVFNAAFSLSQFWDGRSPDLKDQVNGPINNPVEMGSNWQQVLDKLKSDDQFSKEFNEVYPGGLTSANLADAIAEFEKTLITPNSRFDRYLAGDLKALSKDERKGYDLFVKNQCVTCHLGPALGGLSYETMGTAGNYFNWRDKEAGKETAADLGRFNVTGIVEDKYKFKVPTLRNIALTWPYFHDGSTSDLGEAVKIMAKFQNDTILSDDETSLIVKFLNTLTGQYEGKELASIDENTRK